MPISRQDIEAKANELVSAVNQTKESARDTAVLAGVVIAILVLAAFIFGRRRGARNQTVVEVYRVCSTLRSLRERAEPPRSWDRRGVCGG